MNRMVIPGATPMVMLVLTALVLANSCAFASAALSLDQVIVLARNHDAGYRAEHHAASADYADGLRAVAGYGPQVQVVGRYMYSEDTYSPGLESELDDRTASFNEAELVIEAEQPLIDLEKANIAVRGLKEMESAQLRRRKADEDLLLDVCERYYAVLSGYDRLQLAKAERKALRTQVASAAERLAVGFGTITDQYHAEARYQLAVAAEIAAQTEEENAERALEALIGRSVTAAQLEPATDGSVPLLPYTVEHWISTALCRNVDLLMARLQSEQADFSRKAARSRFYPALVLFADYRDRRPDGGLSGYREYRTETDIGLRLEMNLFSGGQDVAGLVAAGQRGQAAKQMVRAAEIAVVRSVRSLWGSIAGTKELIESYQSAAESHRLAVDSTRASFEEGGRVLLEVLDAQQDYYRSLRSLQDARYDYLLLLERFRLVVGVYGNDQT